jgi:hypothetical protein
MKTLLPAGRASLLADSIGLLAEGLPADEVSLQRAQSDGGSSA